MTTDLWMLLAAALLQWVLIFAAAGPRIVANGVAFSLGNRQTEAKPVALWAERLDKASHNLAENLVLFAIVVLVVHVSGNANDTSALGAEIFLAARLAHAAIYVAGIPGVRTLAYVVSLCGMALSVSVLF